MTFRFELFLTEHRPSAAVEPSECSSSAAVRFFWVHLQASDLSALTGHMTGSVSGGTDPQTLLVTTVTQTWDTCEKQDIHLITSCFGSAALTLMVSFSFWSCSSRYTCSFFSSLFRLSSRLFSSCLTVHAHTHTQSVFVH